MNTWNFTGNLGGDCETRYTQNGDPVVSFSVGVKAGYGDKANTTWARCSLFGKRGEALSSYLLKGQLVGIVGELSIRKWTDKQGQVSTSLEVRVNDLTLLGQRAERQEPARQSHPTQRQTGGGIADLESDNIPF